MGLLKWGRPRWRAELLERHGVDYSRAPAEDFATGIVTYLDPDTGQQSMAQFTVSWMYDKQGLRLLIDAIGPGYAFETNSLRSPLEVFIADGATGSVADAEAALEKSTASQGLLAIQPNEPDLYGYVDENWELSGCTERPRPSSRPSRRRIEPTPRSDPRLRPRRGGRPDRPSSRSGPARWR